jgi:lipopolysaccharide export system permease protein
MIIDRYLRREISVPFLAVSIVLVAIFLTFSLTRFLIDANAGLLHPSEVLQLTFLKSLISLEVLLPLSLYLSVLIGLGRLHSDSEIYAMRSSGISELRVLRPIVGVAILLAILIGLFSLFVRPWAYKASYEIKARAEASTEVDRIRAARFYSFEESGRTVFIKAILNGGDELREVFVRTRKSGDLQVITSATGQLIYQARPDYHKLLLHDASVYKRVADGPDVFAELGTFSRSECFERQRRYCRVPVAYEHAAVRPLAGLAGDSPEPQPAAAGKICTHVGCYRHIRRLFQLAGCGAHLG